MSRTFHPRPSRDGDPGAPQMPNKRKRAFYSFTRINGEVTEVKLNDIDTDDDTKG